MKFDGMTLYGAVRAAAATPKGPALIYMGKSISYRRMLRDIDAIAGWFEAQGIGEGDPVTLCMPNIPQCVICFYALSRIGAVAHMVHPLSPENRLLSYMRKAKSKMLVVPDIFAEKYPEAIASYPTLLCSPAHYLGAVARAAFKLSNAKKISAVKSENIRNYADGVRFSPSKAVFSDPNATAIYLHSGGTGGEPKTIELSSRAVNALVANSYDILGITEFNGGCMLAVLPMFHGFGLAMGIHAMLAHGGTDTLMPKFHTKETIRLIAKNKINYIIGVPVLYEALLRRDTFSGRKLRNLKQAFVGGDYVPSRLMTDFDERMRASGSDAKLFEGYGLTETVTVCAVNTVTASRRGSVGKPIGGVTIRAFDANLNPLPPGEEGELCVAGDELMNGYLDDTHETEAFFDCDGKRFVRTGDLGKLDGDGFVFFRSRIKRIAKVNGVSVFPSEIEKLVMDERDEIKEACAAAVADERRGNSIRLFVVPARAMTDDEKSAEADELIAFVEKTLGVYSRPDRVVFLDEFPQTSVGKVDVNALVGMQSAAPDER